MINNYVLLHLHTMLSNAVTNIDSITTYDDYIKIASANGMRAIAFTEHGSVLAWTMKKAHVEAAGMKYIHGIEAYVTESLEEKTRDNYHCILLAKNYDGVKEINALSSKSFNRQDGHFYYAPRITFDELLGTTSNVIITSACLGGILNRGNMDLQKKFLRFFVENKDRCFLEIQHHNIADQIKYNKKLYEISKKTGIRLVVGTDTHALNEDHLDGRKILQQSKNVVFADENDWDLSFKTYDKLIEAYKIQNSLPMEVVIDAINNTNVIADMVEEFTLDKSYKYPHLWEDPEAFFKKRIREGIIWRGVNKLPNFDEYKQRIIHEFNTYKHNGAIDFMLLMDDIIQWCKTQDIQVGYGRGSVNGSVIAYLLGITEMDSIKHKLNFERFMNPERVSLADIDTDFPPSRIEEVKSYIMHKHGLHCCDIVTFNTIADKGAVRDVARAFNMPLDVVGDICDGLDTEEGYTRLREQFPDLFRYVDMVKGTVVSIGNHPCGMVVAPTSINDDFGLLSTSNDPYPISQINMKEIDSLNYVKLDLLKLDTIEVINEACKMAGIERLTPDNIDVNDDNVWNSMRNNTVSIFQWEGSLGNKYIKDLLSDENIEKLKEVDENVDKMTLLSIGNSAIRPAGASYREDLAHGVVRKSGSDAIDEFLKPTFGYLVFQCQIIDFLHQYCGFTMGEADIVRRHFAKKTGTENDIPIIKDGGKLIPTSDHYIPGFIATMAEKYGMKKEEAEETIVDFLKVIEDASSYLFSLNHSQPYSYEGYVEGYLRYYYPLEFLTAAFNINKDNEEKTTELTKYCKTVGINLSSPKFGHSRSGYYFDKDSNTIYKGIGSVKFCNAQIAEELFELSKNQYDSFVELLDDIHNKTSLNSRQLEILTILNFFEDFGKNGYLLKVEKLYDDIANRKQFKKADLEKLGIPDYLMKKYSGKETEKIYKDVDTLSVLNELLAKIKDEPINIKTQIQSEMEYLGYCNSVRPDIEPEYYIVLNYKTFKNPRKPYFKLHNLHDGHEIDTKIKDARMYEERPFGEFSVIYVYDLPLVPKKKLVDGKWIDSDELEPVLRDYDVVTA